MAFTVTGITEYTVNDVQIATIPESIFGFLHLEVLDMSHNRLHRYIPYRYRTYTFEIFFFPALYGIDLDIDMDPGEQNSVHEVNCQK